MLDYLLQVVLFNHCSLILFLIVFPCVCVCICVLCFHLCRHTHVCVYSGSKLISNGGPFCFCFAWFLSYLLSWVSQLNWFSHSSQSTCLRDPLSQFPNTGIIGRSQCLPSIYISAGDPNYSLPSCVTVCYAMSHLLSHQSAFLHIWIIWKSRHYTQNQFIFTTSNKDYSNLLHLNS